MEQFLILALALALLAVVVVLVLGMFTLAKGGAFARKHGNRLMRARIITQGLAVVLLVLAYLATRH